ncbi:MAG: hypothetical protein MUE73_09305, partial [Planctomycetes bacterium]|nr:hypothetical protein [Planctomycetota bacterium]
MRKLAAVGIAVLCLSCDGGGEKAAFERYERAVNPSLEAEADLRRRFDDKVQDYSSYGDESGFAELVEKRMVPFYAEMQATLSAVSPEGAKLGELHGMLLRYVAMRRELFTVFREMQEKEKAREAAEKPIFEKLRSAEKAWGEAGRALNGAVTAAPAAAEVLAPLFASENAASRSLFAQIAALEQGALTAATLREALTSSFDPHYAKLFEEFEKADLPEAVKVAARAYADGARGVLAAAREVADAR